MARAEERGIVARTVEDFQAIPGRGVTAREGQSVIAAGNAALMAELGIEVAAEDVEAFAREGKTPLFYCPQRRACRGPSPWPTRSSPRAPRPSGRSASWASRPSCSPATTASPPRAIARRVGVGKVIADVMPADKERHVRELQNAGRTVAMVGDGINDSPALARADVGLAIGTGADIAKEGADVVLMRSDLMDVARAIELSRATIRNIKQDLFWALFYNACRHPAGGGGLLPLLGWQLSPMVRRGGHEPLERVRGHQRTAPAGVPSQVADRIAAVQQGRV